MGFPTANLPAQKGLEEGIYLATTYWNNRSFPSLAFVGAARTFGESERKVEVYLLDFSGDLYGQELDVQLIKKVRDNKKFDSAEALVAQMKEDERVARKYFGV